MVQNKSRSLFTLAFIFILTSTFAQTSFIVINDRTTTGIEFVYDDPQELTWSVTYIKDGSEISMMPGEVQKFGLENGRVFVSAEIDYYDHATSVFLERIITEPVDIFLFSNEYSQPIFYFLDDSSRYIQIVDPESIKGREQMLWLTPGSNENIENLKFIKDRRTMIEYFRRYNEKDFDAPFPRNRIGIEIALGFTKFLPIDRFNDVYTKDFNFGYTALYSFGIFNERPLKNHHFSTLLSYFISGYNYVMYDEINYRDILIDTRVIQLSFPMMLRYYAWRPKISPFINAGAGWNISRSTYEQYEVRNSEGVISNILVAEDLVPHLQTYFLVGSGFAYHLSYKSLLSFEARISAQFCFASNNYLDNFNTQLVSSYHF